MTSPVARGGLASEDAVERTGAPPARDGMSRNTCRLGGVYQLMATCITCGDELHPDRAEKYDYCMKPDCQRRNAKGLTIVAVGVNKAADQYQALNERTREELATGRYRDASAPARTVTDVGPRRQSSAKSTGNRAEKRPAIRTRSRRPWTRSQQNLAVLYNEQGLAPDEIAAKLGVSRYLATQMVLAARPSR